MKKFFLLAATLMLVGAGCGNNKPTAPVATAPPVANQPNNTTEDDKKMLETCFPLKLANGEYILTAADAAQTLGGEWKVSYELFIDPDTQYVDHCAYLLTKQNDFSSQIVIQTTVPSDTFEPAGKKIIPELGAAYTEDGSLIMKKGKDVIDIGCSKKVGCNEDKLLLIGKIILSRWPS